MRSHVFLSSVRPVTCHRHLLFCPKGIPAICVYILWHVFSEMRVYGLAHIKAQSTSSAKHDFCYIKSLSLYIHMQREREREIGVYIESVHTWYKDERKVLEPGSSH